MVNPEYYDGSTWVENEDTPADSILYCYFTSEPVAGDKTIFDGIISGLIPRPTGLGHWFKRRVDQDTSLTDVWANYLTMTRTDIPYGKYKITWTADIDTTAGNTVCEARVAIDGSPGGKAQTNIDTVNLSGFDVRELDDGSHTVEIDFRRSVGSGTAQIRNAKIIIEDLGRFEEAT